MKLVLRVGQLGRGIIADNGRLRTHDGAKRDEQKPGKHLRLLRICDNDITVATVKAVVGEVVDVSGLLCGDEASR